MGKAPEDRVPIEWKSTGILEAGVKLPIDLGLPATFRPFPVSEISLLLGRPGNGNLS